MGWVVNATTRPLYPQEIPSTHCGGRRSRSGRVQKISPPPPPGFDPRTTQPLTINYADWAIPAPTVDLYILYYFALFLYTV